MVQTDMGPTIYVGLDVSQSQTAICAIGASDDPILQAMVETTPDAIAAVIVGLKGPKVVGMEAAGQSEWLTKGLRLRGLNAIVLEAVRVHRYASVSPIKSDKSDAEVIARLLKGRLFTEVHVKSPEARAARTLLVQRQAAAISMRSCKNAIRGALRAHGVVLPLHGNAKFAQRVGAALEGIDERLGTLLAPQLALWEHHRTAVLQFDQQVHEIARSNEIVRLLQTMPGVGELVSIGFWCTIDDPWRFRDANDVGAYIGLIPYVAQSGDRRVGGKISRHGDRLLRGLLFMGARTAIVNSHTSSDLLDWARRVRERRGPKRATIALARRMAVVMLHMWRNNQEYQPRHQSEKPDAVSLQ